MLGTIGVGLSFLNAVEHMADGLYVLDREWRFTYLNRSVEAFLQRPREELLGRVLWEAFPEMLGSEAERAFRRAVESGAVGELEARGPVSRRWMSARILPSSDGLTVTLCDVTERRANEAARRESEERYRALVETSLDAIFLTAPDGTIFAANPAACQMFQRTEAELIAGGRACVVDPTDPRLRAYLDERERSGHAHGEMRMVRKDGTHFTAAVAASTFVDGAGHVRNSLSVRDLSAREATEATRRLLIEAGRVLPAALDLDATIDAIGHVTAPDFADSAVVDLIDGDRLRRVVTRGDCDRAAGRDRPRQRPLGPACPSGVTRVLATGEPEVVRAVTDAWLHESGEVDVPEPVCELHASVVIVPLAARGHTFGTLAFVRRVGRHAFGADDVALARGLGDRAALALDNARLYNAAVQARKLRDATLGVVSHDLRNPLNTIALNARLLRRHVSGHDAESVEEIRAAVVRASRLVQDLIDVTATESGHLPLVRAPAPVKGLVDEVVALHRTLGLDRSVTIEARIDDPLPAVNVDGHRVVQALSNLLGNALRFAPDESVVTVRARAEGDAVAIDVVDRGPGIPAEQLPHLFDRFWQGQPGAHGCVGLGLAIAKGTAEAHGGRLRVASVPGEGATFTLALPTA